MNKSISDYIPKRTVLGDRSIQKKSIAATEEYREKVKEIVNQLVAEYRETLKLEMSLDSQSIGKLQTQGPVDEQQVQF